MNKCLTLLTLALLAGAAGCGRQESKTGLKTIGFSVYDHYHPIAGIF